MQFPYVDTAVNSTKVFEHLCSKHQDVFVHYLVATSAAFISHKGFSWLSKQQRF